MIKLWSLVYIALVSLTVAASQEQQVSGLPLRHPAWDLVFTCHACNFKAADVSVLLEHLKLHSFYIRYQQLKRSDAGADKREAIANSQKRPKSADVRVLAKNSVRKCVQRGVTKKQATARTKKIASKERKRFFCPKCTRDFTYEHNLRLHVGQVHNLRQAKLVIL